MPTYNAQDLSCSLCLTNSIPIMEAKLPTSKKPALSSITSKCHLQYNIGKYRLRLRRLLIISPTDTYTSTKQSSLFNSHSTLVIQGFDYTLWTFFPRLSNVLDTHFLIQNTIFLLQKDYPYPPYCYNSPFSLYFFHSNIFQNSIIFLCHDTHSKVQNFIQWKRTLQF